MDARAVAEAAAVIDGRADVATLQALSHVTSISFKESLAELVQHGILVPAGEGQWEFTSSANRDQVFGVISRDRRDQPPARRRRQRFGTPVEPQRTVLQAQDRKPRRPRRTARPRQARLVIMASAALCCWSSARNWAARVTTASAVELKAGSTVLLDHVDDVRSRAGRCRQRGCDTRIESVEARCAVRGPRESATRPRMRPHAERIRALARRERIPRIIALDVTGTDSALRVAARLIDGSSGEVLGEESVDTHRAQAGR